MSAPALHRFYQELTTCSGRDLHSLLPADTQREAGHFNVFDLADVWPASRQRPNEALPCRSFYKITLLRRRSRMVYADQVIDVAPDSLVFSSPKAPFQWHTPEVQEGVFCVFSAEFLLPATGGFAPDELPLYRAGAYPVFQLTAAELARATAIFGQMRAEMTSDYAYKYDLLRAYVLELLHVGQKRQPTARPLPTHTAAARLTAHFSELLERQFPLTSPQQRIGLRTAGDFAGQLAVHVNHLNKVLKDTTGRTTSELIGERLAQEARTLLRQTDWTLWEIADSLGFVDVAHFSHFFRRYAEQSPGAFRQAEPATA